MKFNLILFFTLIFAKIFSQSADLDNYYFPVSYVHLPSNPILDNSKRTYSANTKSIQIEGLTRLDSDATLNVDYNFEGTVIADVTIPKTKHQKKDDDGNVISTYYTYNVVTKYSSSAVLTVANSDTATNDVKSYSESDKYKSDSFRSYSKAQSFYNTNKYSLRNRHANDHKSKMLSNANSFLVSKYGYYQVNKKQYFRLMGSKKHPEYKAHQELLIALTSVFKQMKFNQPIDKLRKEVLPSIDRFNAIIPKYVGKKKKMRKVRFASLYNISKIYYLLDMPDKAIEYAQKVIDNDYSKSDGKYYIRLSNELKQVLTANKLKTRHCEIITEDLSNSNQTVKSNVISSGQLEKAYLISKSNDTTLVEIFNQDINNIGYGLKKVVYDENNQQSGTSFIKANNCKELLFINGMHFRNISFKESAVKGGDLDAGKALLGVKSDKLCQILFESDKINLYKFNDEELVFLKPGESNGVSTSSAGFLFGFKKKLAAISSSCTTISEKTKTGAYVNTEESLFKFCEDYNNCSN